jgi:hypothetical protein
MAPPECLLHSPVDVGDALDGAPGVLPALLARVGGLPGHGAVGPAALPGVVAFALRL